MFSQPLNVRHHFQYFNELCRHTGSPGPTRSKRQTAPALEYQTPGRRLGQPDENGCGIRRTHGDYADDVHC
jgi:hypothetical protein